MVAIVAGNGLGLFNASTNTLGGGGVWGQGGALGQAGGRAFANIATGNLILQSQDEQLSGVGFDIFHARTYNAAGLLNDGDGDNWRWDGEGKVALVAGALNAVGGSVARTSGDGHVATFVWSASANAYAGKEGDGAFDKITWDSTTSQWLFVDGSSRIEERYHGTSGLLLTQKDRSGNALNFSYDGSNRLQWVTDSGSGQKIELVYGAVPANASLTRLLRVNTYALTVDANGRATTTLGTAIQQVAYGYDNLGRLTSVTTDLTPGTDNSTADGRVYVTNYAYDGSSFRVASVTQSDGTSVSFTYETSGAFRLKTVTDSAGTQTFTYFSGYTRLTDANNKNWDYYYDANGQLTKVVAPNLITTQFAYDADGNVSTITDGRNNAVTYGYDSQGNRTLERDALGNTVTRTFDAFNQLITETRYRTPDSDGAGSALPNESETTRYVYDNKQRLRYVVSQEGRVSENIYDASKGYLIETRHYTIVKYDVSALTETSALSETQLNNWKAALADKTQQSLSAFSYDYRGNLQSKTEYAELNADGSGKLTNASTINKFIYDEYGQLLHTIVTRGTTRSADGTLNSVNDTKLISTVYDGLGRVQSQTSASGTSTYLYDGVNKKISVTNSAGLTTTQLFDSVGRLISVTQSAASEITRVVNYVYDNAGRLRMVDNGIGKSFTFYDDNNRVIYRVENSGAVIGYDYNENDQVKTETRYNTTISAATRATWLTSGVVTKLSLSKGSSGTDILTDVANDRVIQFEYDNAGRLKTQTDAANTVTTMQYDGTGRLTQKQTGDRITQYFYDTDGKQIGVLDALGYLSENRYDAAGRLIETIRYYNPANVSLSNSAPVWPANEIYTINQNTPVALTIPRASDPEGGALIYSVVGTLPVGLSFDANTRVISGIPTGAIGNQTVIIRASDDKGASTDFTLTLNIVLGNRKPVWPNQSQIVTRTGNTFSATLAPATDADNDVINYRLVSTLPTGVTFDQTNRVISGSTTQAGVYNVVVRATDSKGAYADTTCIVDIRPDNGAPQWTVLSNLTAHVTGEVRYPLPEAIDPDGQVINYSVDGLPNGLRFDSTTRTISGFIDKSVAANSVSTITAYATDRNGARSSATFTITATDNIAPIYVSGISNQTITIWDGEAEEWSYTIPSNAFTDAEGRTLAISVSGLPSWLQFNATTLTLIGTPMVNGTPLPASSFSIAITATDPGGLSSTISRTITIARKTTPDPKKITAYQKNTLLTKTSSAVVSTQMMADVTVASSSSGFDGLRPANSTNDLHQYFYYDGESRIIGQVDDKGFVTAYVYNDAQNSVQTIRYATPVVIAANTSPTWSLNNVNAELNAAFNYTLPAAIDSESTALTYQLISDLPAGLSFNTATRTFSGTPTTLGSFTIKLRVTDNAGASTVASFVLNVNRAPSWSLTNVSADTYVAFSTTLPAAVDPENTAVTYQLRSTLPNGVNFNANTRVLSGTATTAGTYVLAFRATDADGLYSDRSLTLTVNPVNAKPVWPSLTNQTCAATASFSFTAPSATDPEGSTLSYSVVNSLPAGLSFNASTRTISGNPNTQGTYAITLRATDSGGAYSDAGFTLTVSANTAPTWTLNNFSATANTAFSQTLPAALDAEGGTLTYSVVGSLPAGVTFNTSTRTLSGTVTTPGSYTLNLRVTDVGGVSTDRAIVLTVSAPNTAPVWPGSATAAQSAVSTVPWSYVLPAATDAENNALTYSVLSTLPNGISFNSSTRTFSGTPTSGGTHTIQVRVTDSGGLYADLSFNLSIAGNQAPTWTVGNLVLSPNQAFSQVLPAAVDPEGQGLTYAAISSLPTGLSFNASTRTLSGTPTVSGSYNVTFRVTDAGGLYKDVTINVVVDAAPVWSTLTNQTTYATALFTYTLPAATDADSSVLTYSMISGVPNGLAFSPSTRTLSGAATTAGTYTIQVRVTDDRGLSADTSFTLTVNANRAPIAGTLTNTIINIAIDETVGYIDYSGAMTAFSDPEGRPLTYSATGLPAGVNIDASTGKISGDAAIGIYTIVVRATDIGGAYVERSFTATIKRQRVIITPDIAMKSSANSTMIAPTPTTKSAQLQAVSAPVNESLQQLTVASTISAGSSFSVIQTALASSSYQSTTTQFDNFGRIKQRINAEGTITSLYYDNAGRLAREVTAEGQSDVTGGAIVARGHRIRYNAFGEVIGDIQGVGEATLALTATDTDLKNAIQVYGVQRNYDALGRLISTVDANQNKTWYFYDNQNRLTHTVNALGQVQELKYDAFGQVSESISYYNTINTSALTGGPSSQISVTGDNARDQKVTLKFDKRGLLITKITAGFETQTQDMTYDMFGELVTQTQTMEGGRKITTRFDYNKRGEQIDVVRDLGGLNNSDTVQYDAFGRVTRRTDASGQVTQYRYDDSGRKVVITDPLNRTRQTEYDAFSRILSDTDSSGTTTRYSYDDNARSVTITLPQDNIQLTTFKTRFGETLKIVDGKGNTTQYDYNKNGQLQKVTDALGVYTSTDYDESGRVKFTTDARGIITQYKYDALNRIYETIVDAIPGGLNLTTHVDFNSFGQKFRVTEAYGSGNARVTEYNYDRKGQLQTVTLDPDNLKLTTVYKYDALGNQLSVTRGDASNASLHTVRYDYDNLGRRIRETIDPNGYALTTEYRYNANGQVSRKIDAAGNSTWFVYDNVGQLKHVISADGSLQSNDYDDNGRLYHTVRYKNRVSTLSFGDVVATSSISPPTDDSVDQHQVNVFDALGRQRYQLNRVDSSRWVIAENRFDKNNNITEKRQYDTFINSSQVANHLTGNYRVSLQDVDTALINLGYSGNNIGNTRRLLSIFDVNNRLLATVDSLGNVVEQRFDKAGFVVNSLQYADAIDLSRLNTSTIRDAQTLRTALQSAWTNGYNPDAAARQTRMVYDSAGRMRYQIDALNGVSETQYDALGSVIKQTRYGKAIDLPTELNENNIKLAVVAKNNTDQDVRTTEFVYDRIGRMRFKVDALNGLTETIYDGLGRVSEVRQFDVGSNSAAGQISPDLIKNSAHTDAALSALRGSRAVGVNATRGESYDYDTVGNRVWTKDALGNTERYQYDALGNRVAFTNKKGFTWQYQYDALGRLLTETTPIALIQMRGESTGSSRRILNRNSYDALGNLESRTEGIVLDSNGNNANDAEARTTNYRYDALGHQIQTILPGWYDSNSGQVFHDTASGRVQRTVDVIYDVFGQAVVNKVLNEVVNGSNQYIYQYKVYDLLGRVVFDIDALNNVTALQYDGFGNNTLVTRHAKALIGSHSAGVAFSLSEVVNNLPANDGSNRTLTTRYDILGRKKSVEQPTTDTNRLFDSSSNYNATALTEFHYDGFGQLQDETVWLDTTNKAVTSHFYDKLGREIGTLDAEGYYTSKDYDALGNTIKVTEYAIRKNGPSLTLDPNNDRTIEIEYDALNRVKVNRLRNAPVYTLLNNVVTLLSNDSTTKTDYDALGNVIKQTDAAGNVTSMLYDALGHTIRITEPARLTAGVGVDPFKQPLNISPTTEFSFDAQGNMVQSVRHTNGGRGDLIVNKMAYDLAGNSISETDALGNVKLREFTSQGKVRRELQAIDVHFASLRITNGAIPLSGYQYNIDIRYEYDASQRQIATVVQLPNANTMRQSSKYNAFGEVTDQSLNNVLQSSSEYDNAGRVKQTISAEGTTNYFYDRAGHMTQEVRIGDKNNIADDRITRYKYDLLGRVVEQRLPEFTDGVNAIAEARWISQQTGQTPMDYVIHAFAPVIKQTLDRWGNLLTRTDASGALTSVAYDRQNHVLVETLPTTTLHTSKEQSYTAQTIRRHTYDALGNSIEDRESAIVAGTTTETASRTKHHIYNSIGQLIAEQDFEGHVTEYAYDTNGNRVATRNALGTVTVDTFDAKAQLKKHSILRNGDNSAYNSLSGSTTPVEVVLNSYSYDAAGRRYGETEGETESDGKTRYLAFDERSNIVWTRSAGGIMRTTTYDNFNRKTAEIDGNQKSLVWAFDNNNFGRLISHIDLSGNEFQYQYNVFGQVNREEFRFKSTPSSASPDETRNYVYYENGLLASITDKIEQGTASQTGGYSLTEDVSSYSYDINGQKVAELFGSKRIWDEEIGHWEQYGNPNDEYSWGSYWVVDSYQRHNSNSLRITHTEYDELGRIKTIASPSGSVMFEQVAQNTSNLDHMTYYYDEFGNRRAILASYSKPGETQIANYENWYTYDRDGRMLISRGVLTASGVQLDNRKADHSRLFNYDVLGRRVKSESFAGHETQTTRIPRSLFTATESMMVSGIDGDIAPTMIDPPDWDYSTTSWDNYHEEFYQYDDLGGMTLTTSRDKQLHRVKDGVALADIIPTTNKSVNVRQYDNAGRQIVNIDYKADGGSVNQRTVYSYDADGQVSVQKVYNDQGAQSQQINFDGHDGAGNLTHYTVNVINQYLLWYDLSYVGFESYKEQQNKVHASLTGYTPGVTTSKYSSRGVLKSVNGYGGTTINRQFINNREGQILAKIESGHTQDYYYVNGNAIANIGTLGEADFDYNFTPVSDQYPARTPSSYIVNQGDTLRGIAQTVFGDSKLWYIIADANGISSDAELRIGAQLKIPNIVSNIRNDATTFKPYNASEIVGDITPSPLAPPPPPPPSHKCEGLVRVVSSVIGIVVSAIITYVSAGSASVSAAAAGAFASADSAQWLQAMADGDFDWGEFAHSAIKPWESKRSRMGFAISPMAWGVKNYDYVATGVATASGAATAYVGGYGGAVAGAAAGYVTNYGLNRLAGREVHWRNRDLLASMGQAVVKKYLGDSTNEYFDWNIDANNSFKWGELVQQTLVNAASSGSSYLIKRGLGDNDASWRGSSELVDAFGNAFGSTASNAMSRFYQKRALSTSNEAENARLDALAREIQELIRANSQSTENEYVNANFDTDETDHVHGPNASSVGALAGSPICGGWQHTSLLALELAYKRLGNNLTGETLFKLSKKVLDIGVKYQDEFERFSTEAKASDPTLLRNPFENPLDNKYIVFGAGVVAGTLNFIGANIKQIGDIGEFISVMHGATHGDKNDIEKFVGYGKTVYGFFKELPQNVLTVTNMLFDKTLAALLGNNRAIGEITALGTEIGLGLAAGFITQQLSGLAVNVVKKFGTFVRKTVLAGALRFGVAEDLSTAKNIGINLAKFRLEAKQSPGLNASLDALYAPEMMALELSGSQLSSMKSLLGKALRSDLPEMANAWESLISERAKSGLTAANQERRWNYYRGKWWEKVNAADTKEFAAIKANFEAAGFQFDGKAPFIQVSEEWAAAHPDLILPDNRRIVLTIDHIEERQSAFTRTLDSDNLQFSFARENTQSLRRLHMMDPFLNPEKHGWKPVIKESHWWTH